MRTALVALCCLFLFAFATTAQAAQRYASPSGGGTECSPGKPCGLTVAVESAKANDEVIIGAGIYPVAKPLALPAPGIYLHGDLGGPMPTLSAAFAEGSVVGAIGTGSRVAWLDIIASGDSGTGLTCYEGGRIERVRVTVSGGLAAAGITGSDCEVSSSMAVATGEHGVAIRMGAGSTIPPGVVRNVTAIGTGSQSAGVVAFFNEPFVKGTYSLHLTNTIASGLRADIAASGTDTASAEITVSYSNFDKPTTFEKGNIVDGGGNQTAAPIFVNAAAGDYREAPGSPTIDAGLVGPGIGALDLAGNPRVIGGSVDIGAYEFVPLPPPVVVPAQVQSLAVSPNAFKPVNLGEAIISAKKKPKAPVATTVSYSLSAAATVTFGAERKASGRKAGKKCVKTTKANRSTKKCTMLKPVKGSFTHPGAVGANRFKFSGRIGGKALVPGGYVLTASAGSSSKTASFKIVK